MSEGYWVGWYAEADADPRDPSGVAWTRFCSHDDYKKCLGLLRLHAPYGRMHAVMLRGGHPACVAGGPGASRAGKPGRAPGATGRVAETHRAVLTALRGRWLTRRELLARLAWGEGRRREVGRALATLEAAGEVRRRGPRGAAEYSAAGA